MSVAADAKSGTAIAVGRQHANWPAHRAEVMSRELPLPGAQAP